MHSTSLPDQLSEQQLEHYLTLMIEKILAKLQKDRPDLKVTAEKQKELAGFIAKTMMKNGEFKREAVIDKNPVFLLKLTMALVMTAKLGSSEKLFNQLEKILTDNKLTEKDLKNDALLKEKLSPVDFKQLKLMMDKIQETLKDLEKLDLIKLPKPVPGAPPSPDDIDPNSMLLGLVATSKSSSMPGGTIQAGGIRAVITYFVGNLTKAEDRNPFHGEAPLDQTNKAAKKNAATMGDIIGEVKAILARPAPKI